MPAVPSPPAPRLPHPSTGAALTYDPLGRLYRVASPTTAAVRFAYDGDHVIAEYDDSGNVLRRYVWGLGADEPLVWYEGSAYGNASTNRRSLLADERGSIIAVSDQTGAITSFDTYDEYGIPSLSNAGRFQYTGQVWIPEIGLYHYKARAYSPTLGRFMQTDPVGYKDDRNLYAYVKGDPINSEDPQGTESASVTCANRACGQLPPPPPDKHGTTIVGVSGGVAGKWGPVGGSVSGSAGVAFNKSDAEIYISGSGTGGGVLSGGNSASAGVTVGHHDGDPVDTGGPFGHVSVTGGDGVAVTVDHYRGSSADGTRTVTGTNITIGPGAGLSGGVGGSLTGVATPNQIRDALKAPVANGYNSILKNSPLACSIYCVGR